MLRRTAAALAITLGIVLAATGRDPLPKIPSSTVVCNVTRLTTEIRGQDTLCKTERRMVTRKEEDALEERRKCKEGLVMSQRKISAEKLREIRDLAAGWGKIVARRTFGDAGPDIGVDLTAMEQIAATAAAGLTESTLAILLEQQARSLGGAQPCPDCGRRCAVGFEDRPLAVKGGRLTLHEPVCHCPGCRRDFFPPEGLPAPG